MKKMLLSAWCFLLASTALYADTPHYALMIEANKNNSALFLLSITPNKNMPDIEKIFSDENAIGLSSFAAHPDQAGSSLKKILDDVMQIMKQKNISSQSVSVDVLGADGMRSLSQKSQAAIYANVKIYLASHYDFSIHDIKTISGKVQGAYEWLALNYLENKFNSEQDLWGVMNENDDSLQIAFVTDRSSHDTVTFQIHGRNYIVYSKRFSAGLDVLRDAMNQTPTASACYPQGYIFSNQKVSGDYHFSVCSANYKKLLDTFHFSKKIPAYDQIHFAVLGDVANDYLFFGVEDASEEALIARMNDVCEMSWDQMQLEYADSGIPDTALASYCANGVALEELFYQTLHLDAMKMWVTENAHDGEKIHWVLGALIDNVGGI